MQTVVKKRRRVLTKDAKAAYLLLLPFFLFFAAFVLYPLISNFFTSFTNASLSPQREFVGLRNYAKLLRDDNFLHSVRNTLLFAAGCIVPLMVLGFCAALCVNRQTKAMFAARAILIFPYVSSMVAVSMVWLYLFEPSAGFLNKALWALGLPGKNWLFDESLALGCLIAVNVWKNMGYVMLLYLAALQSVPLSLYDAAKVDGANFLRRTWHITLPAIQPVSAFLLATLCIECFKTFDQVRIMTNGGPLDATTTMTHQIFIRGFSEFKMGYASAMSVALFVIIFAVTLLNLRFGGQMEREGGRS